MWELLVIGGSIFWIAYWPWSAFWEITRNLFTNIYESLLGVYQGVTDKALAEIKELNSTKE